MRSFCSSVYYDHRHLCPDCAGAGAPRHSADPVQEHGDRVPAWCGFVGASGLVLSPLDLIPDVIPVIGWADDAGLWHAGAGLRLYLVEAASPQADDRHGDQHGANATLPQGKTTPLAPAGSRTARQAFVGAGEPPCGCVRARHRYWPCRTTSRRTRTPWPWRLCASRRRPK